MIHTVSRAPIGSNPAIQVLSRREAEDAFCRPKEPYAIISIGDPEQADAALGSDPHCRGVLRLRFHDISDPQLARHHGLEIMHGKAARDAVAFALEHGPHVRTLLIHCEAGISRSAGIAAALGLWFHQTDQEFYERYIPNAHCKAMVLRAFDTVERWRSALPPETGAAG